MSKTCITFNIEGASKIDISTMGIRVWDEHDRYILGVSPSEDLTLTVGGATPTSFKALMRLLDAARYVEEAKE